MRGVRVDIGASIRLSIILGLNVWHYSVINSLLLLSHNLRTQGRQLRQILIHVKLKLGVDLHLVIGKSGDLTTKFQVEVKFLLQRKICKDITYYFNKNNFFVKEYKSISYMNIFSFCGITLHSCLANSLIKRRKKNLIKMMIKTFEGQFSPK